MFDTRLFYQQVLGDRRNQRPMPQRITRLGTDRPAQRQQAERR
jgi:hypothetical protein